MLACMCVCASVRVWNVRMWVCVCVCAWVCACACEGMCVRVRQCVRVCLLGAFEYNKQSSQYVAPYSTLVFFVGPTRYIMYTQIT